MTRLSCQISWKPDRIHFCSIEPPIVPPTETICFALCTWPKKMQFLSGITKNWFVFLSQLPFVLSPATLLSCIIEYHQLKKTWFVNIEYIIDKFKRINRKWFKPINRIDFIFWSKNYNGEGFMLFLNKNLFSNPLIHFNARWNPR